MRTQLTGVMIGVATMLGGCELFSDDPDDGGGAGRCEQDRYACQEESAVPPLAGCDLDGELTVTVGRGMERYEAALLDGEPLPLFMGGGGFQSPGVAHVGLALRIEGAALDRYDVVGADLSVYPIEACMTLPDDGGLACDGVPWVGQRSVLLGDDPALNVVGSVVEEFGLTLSWEDPGSGTYVLQATVEDPCGQVGVVHHDFSL